MKKFPVLLLIALTSVFSSRADIQSAAAELNAFRSAASNGMPGAQAYNSLYRAFELYRDAIATADRESDDRRQARTALLEIYPRLSDAAYFHASLNDKETVLKYACAFVDVSLIPQLEADRLQANPQYAILANLAATNLYNKRDYNRSIRYFQAYLESGDLTNRERAFEGLARCHFESKDFGSAANICSQATKFYPNNWNLLIIGIEAAGKNGNDDEMGQMLKQALALQPSHPGLLEYQGKLFERRRDYLAAAQCFDQIRAQGRATLDHHCHLAFDYYNAATLAYSRDSRAEASTLFAKAAPLLRTVLDNQPYAANVARALAFCYSATNDATRLQEANNTLSSLHSPRVDFGALPTLVSSYTPSAELNPVSDATTRAIAQNDEQPLISDVDINIPETGLRRPNTCVIIIANEDYTRDGTPKVDFAKRDGEIFRQYCIKTLGVPEDNVRMTQNATRADIEIEVNYLSERCNLDPDKLDIIFYYAGHGVPDYASQKSYLMPVDGRTGFFNSCFDLNELYARLDEIKARNVTVFLDACFSGAARGEGMISKGRYVRMKEADVKAKGKTIVFSAASNDEAAIPYMEKGHGMFTYYLLKILQETRGNITLAELGDRLHHDVRVKTIDKGKTQTPTVKAAEALGSSWQSRRLID